MNPVVTVTINPEAKTAKEIDWSVSGCSCFACIRIRERLRTFEIEYPKCTCKTVKQMEDCPKECEPYETCTTHTAEILETYPEPVNGIAGRCKILS